MIFKNVFFSLLVVALTSFGFAQDKDIVEVAAESEDHTTLVAAVKAGELVETLQSDGPFTVFAPVNRAFEALPDGTVDYLLQPDNKEKLQMVLTYHVVPGEMNAEEVVGAINEGGGKAQVETAQGGMLTLTMEGDAVKVMDAKGNTATVVVADLDASNGVIHVVDTVLLP